MRPMDKRSEPTKCLVRYLLTFVNYDENDWYQLLPLAEHAYNNSATNAHKITLFIANYAFHPQTQWMKEREAHNPRATMYAHRMQDIHLKAQQTLENTAEWMKQYYHQNATGQPDIEAGD